MRFSCSNRSGQVSIEFLFLFGLLFSAIVIFMAILAQDFQDFAITKEENVMKDFGRYLQNELILAADLNDGYNREIYLPQNIGGIDYSISNTQKSFTIISYPSKLHFTYHIPKIQGSLQKGTNLIHKEGGVVYIN